MDEQAPDPVQAPAARPRRGPVRWLVSGTAKSFVSIALLAMLGVAALLALLDTGPGHRLIVDRIAAVAPDNGLRIRIGRIEGSIWGRTRLRDVRLYDPQGLFAEAPQMEIDWRLLAFLTNRLLIHELESDLVILHRLPRLEPSEEPGPVLPGFDVHVGRLDIAQVRIREEVIGEERSGRLAGELEIRRGRALVDLRAEIAGGGDRLAVRLDAEPDRDRFDLDVRVHAPANSVLGAMMATRHPIRLVAGGDGSWSRWRGRAELDVAGRPAARLGLAMRSGDFAARGIAAPAPFLRGKLQRLTAPRVAIAARGRIEDSRIRDGALSLRSGAMRLEARGGIDLAEGAYRDVRIAAELLRPPALFPNMTGRQVRAAGLLDGRFGQARFSYRATAPRIQFDNTGFEEVRLQGSGALSRAPVVVPVAASARRVTGNGERLDEILAGLRIEGRLQVTPERMIGEGLALASARLRGRMGLAIDLRSGRYLVTSALQMPNYPLDGFGIVDVAADLRAEPGPGGRGTQVNGTGRAAARRLDNRFLAWAGGGLPRLETGFTRGPDRVIRFQNLRMAAPKLQLAGSGMRRTDGTFLFEGGGGHEEYGPLRLTLDGRIERPQIALRLARPADTLGLADVVLNLDPNDAGFAWTAEGGSTLGPFSGQGAILLPAGAPAVIDVGELNVSGTSARGALTAVEDGFSGRLAVAGGGLTGALQLAPYGGHQRIAMNLEADDASFAGPPAMTIRRGRIESVILLDPAGTSVEARIAASGLNRGYLSLARLNATASLRGGRGQVRADIAGSRGRDFAFNLAADVAPGQWRVTGGGRLDRRPIEITSPAVVTHSENGWRLAPTSLLFAGGTARVAGEIGAATALDAELQAMPLGVLDIFYPRLGLGGVASGQLRYREPAGGGLPSGEANLRVRGLTRAGLVLSSRPVDAGLNARLAGGQGAMRAVAVSDGRVIGRAQARLRAIPQGPGDFAERLARAPLQAQLRYSGPADTLWRLTGVELLDLSGPAAIAADINGSFERPSINGSVRTAGARLESAVTGMVITNLNSAGRFDGSRLRLEQFRGQTERGGSIAGSGVLDFGVPRGVGMDISVQAQGAQLLDRDDIKVAVTGPIAIRSNGQGGTISGDVRLVDGAFRLGSATSAARVSRLNVREINRPDEGAEPLVRRISPWQLQMTVNAPERLAVTGLGMTSEWNAQLRIGGSVTQPRINGDAELIRGTYDFAGRRFDLTRGNIRFQGESPINPVLDIAAEARVRGLAAQIRVTGRSERPEIAFTSVPALPQEELLSRILFGTSITNLSAPEAVQLAAAIASLNDPDGGLDPINAVRRSIGLDRLRILPADVTQGIGPSVAAGKYFGRRVYVEVVTDGRGYSATSVEYQITRWLSLLSSISTIGRESVNVRVSRDY